MKRLLLFIFALPLFAGLPAATVWEVRHAGSDTNGGAFITGSTGTDMSQFDNKNAAACSNCQSATVNISTTDAVLAVSTTVTSATANFSAAIVGNVIRVSGGSCSETATWVQVVTFVNATTITVDHALVVCTGVTMNIGGALGSVGQGNLNCALSTGAGVWVKADATYTVSVGTNASICISAPNSGVPFFSGYMTTRGDGGQPTIQGTAGGGSDFFMVYFNNTPSGTVFSNFILDCNNLANVGGLRFHNVNYGTARNVHAENCSDAGFYWNGVQGLCDHCWTTNTPAAGITGDTNKAAFFNTNGQSDCFNCAALGSTVNGAGAFVSFCGGNVINPIAANFTGTTADAFTCTTQEQNGMNIIGATVYNFTRDALRYGENSGIDMRPLTIRNWVISNIGGFCFDQVGSLVIRAGALQNDHNACNTTGAMGFYNGWPAGVGDVTLTANPFTNGGSNDFSLNSTAGGGAAAKAVGFPGVTVGGTGHIDMGALQSAASAGGAQTVVGYAQ